MNIKISAIILIINIVFTKAAEWSECVNNTFCNNCQINNICLKKYQQVCGYTPKYNEYGIPISNDYHCSEPDINYECGKIGNYYCCKDTDCRKGDKCEGGICKAQLQGCKPPGCCYEKPVLCSGNCYKTLKDCDDDPTIHKIFK